MNVEKFLEDAENEILENFETQAETTTWGLERENQTVRPDGSVPDDRLHQQTLANIAFNHPSIVNKAESDERSPRNIPKEVKMDAEELNQWAKQNGIDYDIEQRSENGPSPVNDVDLWIQLEIGTSAWKDLSAMLGEAEAQYKIAENCLPENLVFNNRAVTESITYDDKRKGLTLDFVEETYDAINDYLNQISDKGRYVDYVKFFGPAVLLNGLTGSVQLSGQPRKKDNISWQQNISEYQVGSPETPGIQTLKPIQRIPFSNSLLTEDGEKESIMGRKKVWDLTPTTSPVLTKEEGQSRHGIYEEFFEKAEEGEEYGITVSDQLEVLLDRDLVFTAGITEENLDYLDDSSQELHERYEHLEQDQEYNVIVMSPDRDPESTQTLREFLEAQEVTGMISVENPDSYGEFDEIPVEASFEDLDYDEFWEIAWNNTKTQNSTNWPYDRLRFGGWFEDRVECDSEDWDDAAIHSAVWKQKWPEIQNIAANLNVENSKAKEIEQKAYEEGEDYELAQEFYDRAMVDHYEAAAALVGPDRAEKYIQNLEESLEEGSNATKEYKSRGKKT